MSTLFQDAGHALNLTSTPSSSKANAKGLRKTPFTTRKARIKLFDAANGEHPSDWEAPLHEQEIQDRLHISLNPLQDKENALANNECCDDRKVPAEQFLTEPTIAENQSLGGGEVSLTAQKQQRLAEVVYPDLTTSNIHYQSSNAILDTAAPGYDLRPSSTSCVETWLTDVSDQSQPDPVKSYASSIPSIAARSLLPETARSHRHPPCLDPQSESSYLALEQSPPSPDNLTKYRSRKIQRLSPAPRRAQSDMETSIVIYEDETSDELMDLSPKVQRYRKGCGPKRKRCPSYWDSDIVPELATPPPKQPTGGVDQDTARQTLGELVPLPKAKAFSEDAENALFDFKVRI